MNPQSPAGRADTFRLIEVAGDLTNGIARNGSARPIATFGLRSDAVAFLDWLATRPLRGCAACDTPTRGAGNSEPPLCDVCYNAPLACACGTVTSDGERCAECRADLAEYRRDEYRTERDAELFNDDGCRTPEGCER